MKRKIYEKLLNWKNKQADRYALLVEGARRTGKSYIVEEFARAEYAHHLILDFSIVGSEIKELFNEKLGDLNEFFMLLESRTGVSLSPRNSLIVFDEVQRFPRAREAIKTLVKDGRFHYIETGSLISIKKNVENILIPSEELKVRLYPMDFEEFLWALGREGLVNLIRHRFERREQMGQTDHRRAMEYFRQYMVVGGMPQSVAAFAETRNLETVEEAKQAILGLYADDIGKFAGRHRNKVRAIWSAIPGALSGHSRRFQPGYAGRNVKSRELVAPFEWLKDSMTVNLCRNATDPNSGFCMTEDESAPKCYMGDTGLLASHAFADNETSALDIARRIITGSIELNKGMLVENVVAQMLTAAGQRLFYHTERNTPELGGCMEIDFLLTRALIGRRKNVYPMEVKSGTRYATSSLDKFMRKYPQYVAQPIVLHPSDFKSDGNKLYFPLYMASLLPGIDILPA